MLTDQMTLEQVEELRRMVFDKTFTPPNQQSSTTDPARKSFSGSSIRRRVVIVTFSLPVNVKLKKSATDASHLATCHVSQNLDPAHELMVDLFNELQRANFDILWFGWPGLIVPSAQQQQQQLQQSQMQQQQQQQQQQQSQSSSMSSSAFSHQTIVTNHSPEQAIIFSELGKMNMMPVFLSQNELEHGCYEFARRALWPLFHYLPQDVQYVKDIEWDSYLAMNKTFCDTIRAFTRSSDIFFINDYELMLLPSMLRDAFGGDGGCTSPIGFFLHTAFPDQEVYRLLPWRNEILNGVLSCDLIGLYAHHWVRNFLSAVYHLLGKDNDMGRLLLDFHELRVDAFNPCVDVNFFMGVKEAKVNTKPVKSRLLETYSSSLSAAVSQQNLKDDDKDLLLSAAGDIPTSKTDIKYILAVNDTSRNRCLSNTIHLFEMLLTANPDLHEYAEKCIVFTCYFLSSSFAIIFLIRKSARRRSISYEGESSDDLDVPPLCGNPSSALLTEEEETGEVTHTDNTGDELNEDIIDNICKQIGHLNGTLGTLAWRPVILMHRPFNKLERRSIYMRSDLAFIPTLLTSVNMFAMEYVATRSPMKTGILVMSELSASSAHLQGCVRINPVDEGECIKVLRQAIQMPPQEQEHRLAEMNDQLCAGSSPYSSGRPAWTVPWALDFVHRLVDTADTNRCVNVPLLIGEKHLKLLKDFNRADERLVILSYDGTVLPFNPDPVQAEPDSEILSLLKTLSTDPKTVVVLNTGRDRNTLNKWFKSCPELDMVAEHGIWLKQKGEWTRQFNLTSNWKRDVVRLVQDVVDRTPGSVIEEKENSVAWHFRNVDRELGDQRTREFKDLLLEMTAHTKLQVFESSKVIDIKESGYQKGRSVQPWLNSREWAFVLAIGNSPSDEDTFKVLPIDIDYGPCYSVKVGPGHTQASSYVLSHLHVRTLLRDLASHCQPPETH